MDIDEIAIEVAAQMKWSVQNPDIRASILTFAHALIKRVQEDTQPRSSSPTDAPNASRIQNTNKGDFPIIPTKRYFTTGEVSNLCGVKPHVLRYWEQEFSQLRPVKRRGNRRFYQYSEVLLIRRIRELLYVDGLTISGVRNRLGALDDPR